MPSPSTFKNSNFGPPPSRKTAKAGWISDLMLIALLASLWFCGFLGMRPLANPDEGRYTEIPREMAVTGDFVTPRLNGVKYFEKPPLVYWLSGVTFRTFGVNEFTARLWNGLFSVLGVLLTYAAARALYDRNTGIWAAIVLSTFLLYFALSQIVLLDMAVAVTISGALFAFIVAMREPAGKKRFGLFMVFYTFMALATLSKGLIGIALPGAVLFFWVLLLNRWRALCPFYPITGSILLLAIAAPWHILAAQANPDFLNFYFYHEHWLRFTTTVHGRFEPWWFFLPVFVGGLFPWLFFAVRATRFSLPGGWKARKDHPDAWFLIIWIVFIILFFSKSQSKLVPYILPVFPACAVLMGRWLSALWVAGSKAGFRPEAIAFVVTTTLLGVAVFFLPNPKGQPDLVATLPLFRVFACIILVGGAGVVFLGYRRANRRLVIGAIAASTALFLGALAMATGSFDKASTRKFAMVLKPILKADDRVYLVGFHAMDLPAYLSRLVSVVEYDDELNYGINAEPNISSQRFLDRSAFAEQWKQPGDAYALIRKSNFEKWFGNLRLSFEVMDRSDRFVLIKRTDPPSP